MWSSGPFRDRETLAPAFNHLTPLNTAEIGGGEGSWDTEGESGREQLSKSHFLLS